MKLGFAVPVSGSWATPSTDRLRRTRDEIVRLSRGGLDWVTFSTQVTETLGRLIRFDRSCWHTVDRAPFF